MKEKTVSVTTSLEASSFGLFVQTANKFSSRINITIDDKTVNAKSIMGIISLGILSGNELTIIADGEDEEVAVHELAQFLKMD